MRAPAFLTRFRAPRHPTDEEMLALFRTLPPDHPINRPSPLVQAWLDEHPEVAGGAPLPTFTPLPPNVRVTAPIHIPAGRHTAPGRIRVARTDPAAMGQALRGARGIDFAALDAAKAQEGLTHAGVRQANVDPLTCPDWPMPERPDSRAGQFAADMRMAKRGGLPLFRQAARRAGWSGLDEERPARFALGYPGWLDDWGSDSLHVISAQSKTARIEVEQAVIERRNLEARLRAAADAAPALGYPAEAL